MTNLDAMCQQTFDHHQELLAEAARRRMTRSRSQEAANRAPTRSWRVGLAARLRRAADWLEPVADPPQVAMLRAVAHREITIDQAMRLLDTRNGQRSAGA